MKTVFRAFFTIWAYLTFIFLMMIVFFYHILVVVFTRGNRVGLMYKSYRPWALAWAFLNGVKITVKGYENYSRNRSYIFVSNHGSAGDIVIVAAAMLNRYRPLGKIEVTKIPVMGYMFKRALITVDRSSPESRKESMDKMRDLIKRNISVLILPEGTRNRTDKPLQSFHDGAFRLAIEFQLPIVPMVLLNTRKLYPNDSLLMNHAGLACHFLEQVPTNGLTDDDIRQLKDRVFGIMEKHIVEHDPQFAQLRKASA